MNYPLLFRVDLGVPEEAGTANFRFAASRSSPNGPRTGAGPILILAALIVPQFAIFTSHQLDVLG